MEAAGDVAGDLDNDNLAAEVVVEAAGAAVDAVDVAFVAAADAAVAKELAYTQEVDSAESWEVEAWVGTDMMVVLLQLEAT